MFQSYKRAADGLAALRGHRAVIVHSEHMANECARHGINAEVVYLPVESSAAPSNAESNAQILYVGRMERRKGGRELLAALPLASRILGRGLAVRLVGDGPDRERWELLARDLPASVHTTFSGWLDADGLSAEFATAALLVVPSVWPEPFGMVGLEAASRGVPAAAFGVGGIPEWLTDGHNGALAPGSPPTVQGLADAIVRCLGDAEHHRALRRGALEVHERFTRYGSVDKLLGVLRYVAAER
jgi:glycosyltransferase involved in cell wall biosynthesis